MALGRGGTKSRNENVKTYERSKKRQKLQLLTKHMSFEPAADRLEVRLPHTGKAPLSKMKIIPEADPLYKQKRFSACIDLKLVPLYLINTLCTWIVQFTSYTKLQSW